MTPEPEELCLVDLRLVEAPPGYVPHSLVRRGAPSADPPRPRAGEKESGGEVA